MPWVKQLPKILGLKNSFLNDSSVIVMTVVAQAVLTLSSLSPGSLHEWYSSYLHFSLQVKPLLCPSQTSIVKEQR